jgi:hypothetical protein
MRACTCSATRAPVPWGSDLCPLKAPTFVRKAPTFVRKAPTFVRKAPTFVRKAPTFVRKAPTFVRTRLGPLPDCRRGALAI